MLEQETKKLSNVKTKETKILDNLSKGKYQDIQFEIEKLQTVQSELLEYGDELHTEKTKKALNVILKKLAIEQNFDDFDLVADLLSAISENKDVKKWQTVCRTIRRCGNKIKYSSELSNALVKIITDDKFEDLLWVTAKEMPDKWLPTTSKEIRNLIDGPNQLPYTPLEAVQLLLDELQGAIDKIVNDDLSSLSQNNANQVKDTSDHSSINDSIDKITKFNTIKNIIKNIKDSWANKTNLEIEKLISAIETLESVSNKSLAKATIDAKFIIGQLQRYLDNTQFEWQSKEYDINKLTKIKENLRIIFSWILNG